MAVKPGKPDRKRNQRDSAAPRKTSHPPSASARPPAANSARPPAANAAPSSRSSRPRPPRPETSRPAPFRQESSQPEITLKRAVAGRDTLHAIAEELARDAPQKHRPKLDTLDYEDRPVVKGPRTEQTSSPEVITIGEATMGRATMEAIDEALAAEARAMMAAAEADAEAEAEDEPTVVLKAPPGSIDGPPASVARARTSAVDTRHAASFNPSRVTQPGVAPRATLEPAQIFEISTFIVEGEEIFSKASDKSRRDFVEQRLLHRLPALSMEEVVRIDVSRGAAPNTVILRVWSKVVTPHA